MDIERSTILIPGGAGYFGRAFAKKALSFSPKAIRLVDHNEGSLVDLERNFKDSRLRFMYGDVRDKERLKCLMANVDIVVHCAALKHVPLCEYNPTEAIKTNVLGSVNIVEVAQEMGVRKVIGISSDKAVYPINTYGASKLLMEHLFLEANNYAKTKFSCVRLGNLWGSDGSVIQRWMAARAKGEPIQVTERDMSRYWINEDEAIQFTIESIDKMQGGEIFIPMMPLHTLNELIGKVAPDSTVEVVGRRKGEKKHEELYNEEEAKYLQRNKDSLVIKFT